MSIASVAINRPVFAWMLMASCILFGAISFTRMGMSNMPDVDFPVVNVALRLDNASPEMMEVAVVDIIEDALMGISGLEKVSSSVSQGIANITCEFAMKHSIHVALQEVHDRIDQVNNKLPTALFPPVITKTNPEDVPLLWVMLTADEHVSVVKQMMTAKNVIKDQLSTIEGVGSVMFAGFIEPNLRVWMDRKKLYGYDLTSTDIFSAIQNEQIEQPAGRLETSQTETNIRVFGEASTPRDFGKIRLNTRRGSPNYHPLELKDIARIEEGVADVRQISRYDGKPVVGLGIVKQHGANAVEVGARIHERVEKMKKTMLPGFSIAVELDSTKYIHESVRELTMTLIYSAILTSIVCFLFLGSLSSTINVLVAIPTSIVGAFTAMYFFGFTLNTFTLLGLSLAIGIVVDDAIMMLENIVRHYEMGKKRRDAALDGANEITFAAFATTLAIGAIFIPVIFMQGVVGKFFYQYGVTVTVAVFLSLLEAVTLTPMRCAEFLSTAEDTGKSFVLVCYRATNRFMDFLETKYRKTLDYCLGHASMRQLLVYGSILFFVASLFLVRTLRQELIPPQDQSLFLVSIRLPVESAIQVTDAVYKKAEQYLAAQKEVKHVYATVGNFENNNVVNNGVIYVAMTEPANRSMSQQDFMRHIKEELTVRIPTGSVMTKDLSIAGLSASRGYPVEFYIDGPDFNKVKIYADIISKKAIETHVVEDLASDFQDHMREIHVYPDRKKASYHGVAVSTIGQEMNYLIGGQIFNSNTQYPTNGHRYDIRLRAEPQQTQSVFDVGSLLLYNDRGVGGGLLALSHLARIEESYAPQLISRVNRRRAIGFYGNLTKGSSQYDALRAIEKIGKQELQHDPSYQLKMSGSALAFSDAFTGLFSALILGVVIAYMILASQFNSFIHPIIVLVALPFSVSGAFLALFLTNQSLSLFSMIGLILLMGIVKKNSILLVDFTNQKRREGKSLQEALILACPVRLRPILMTSLATVVGALPEALNFGSGAETRVPMAIAVIGGVSLSTFLTLFVVPCLYMMLSRFESRDEMLC